MQNKEWDKITERRINHTDHDTLIELVTIIRVQTENAKNIAENLKLHEIKDEDNFQLIRKEILVLQKVIWIATGIIIGLDAIPRIYNILHILK